jgi:hypothetical protein
VNKLVIQGIVLVLMLAALPLTSAGTISSAVWLAYAGLALFALAAATPPVLRFVGGDDDDEGSSEGSDDDETTEENR